MAEASGAGAGERDLTRLLAGMAPSLDPQRYAFTVAADAAVPPALPPLMAFREDEGLTLVLRHERALAAGLDIRFVCRRIVLEVHSALDAVGLLAAVTTALAEAGIAVNAVSAVHHDHLFVPADRADEALAVLETLSAQTR